MKDTLQDPIWLSKSQNKKLYGFSVSTQNRRIADGTFEAVKCGAKVMISHASIKRYVAALPPVQGRTAAHSIHP